jgi:carbonic anhydrase
VIDTDELVRRNAEFVAGGTFADLPLRSTGSLRVIGCVDPRVDPSHVLGLKFGDAVVMRNVGGRVTPATLRSWAMLAKVAEARRQGQPQPGGHLVVLHHTDCGITAVMDPRASVAIDVDIIKRALPPGLPVSGLVYDVHTGLVETVVPPAAR